jgi:uncharacterized protein YkwD
MFMKNLLPLLFCLISLTTTSQITWEGAQCYYIDDKGNEVEVSCDNILPTPVFTGNIDSLCWEMEKRFVDTLNEWRVNHGLNKLEYDDDMESLLTVPWNENQVKTGKVGHGKGYNSFTNRSDRVGIGGYGECCASNGRNDKGDVSQFFIQYKESPPHWKILTDGKYNYISVSVLYDRETNTYYSVVNVRK